ncbi:hypothetical protein NS220_16180 [Microbacterium testaceum]|uniref:Uncharacterized protein n=1 Tax=Microbacterium testaceum TaxID=2033 RepID=A0A147ETH8_MICTE|nr:hypothetical protein NS220_16180 [Microbacterium testaceum]
MIRSFGSKAAFLDAKIESELIDIEPEDAAERDAAALKAAAQHARQTARADAIDRLVSEWGSERGAHDRLRSASVGIERLHRLEAAPLREPDELVRVMRVARVSWSTLSVRTNLSRQALMKHL